MFQELEILPQLRNLIPHTKRKDMNKIVSQVCLAVVVALGFVLVNAVAILSCIVLLSMPQNVLANSTITDVVVPCENCSRDVKVTGEVTVTVHTGLRTVMTGGTGADDEIGISTAEYIVKAESKAEAVHCECMAEINPVNPRWSTLPHGVEPLPPEVNPVPPDPTVDTDVGIEDGAENKWKWHPRVFSPVEGEWNITFKVEVEYELKSGDAYLYNSDDPPTRKTVKFPGQVTFRFKATTNNFRIVLLPQDNFDGRSLSALGVGETGEIKVESIGDTLPANIFPLQSFSSSNTIAFAMSPNLTTGTATFTAGSVKGNTVITAKDKYGNEETYVIEVVEPQGVRFVEVLGARNTDKGNSFPTEPDGSVLRGAQFYARMYLQPTDVSFNGVTIGEEGQGGKLNKEVKAIATGTLQLHNNLEHRAWYRTAGSGNILEGSRVAGLDEVGFTAPNIPGHGKFTWNIPWSYQTKNMQNANILPKEFLTMIQECENIGNKLSTVSKNGITVSRTIP